MGKLKDMAMLYAEKVQRAENTAVTAEMAFYMGACTALLAKTDRERDNMMKDFQAYQAEVIRIAKGGK